MNDLLANVLHRVSGLAGVVPQNSNDELAIQLKYFDDYLLVEYLGQLLERGEMTIEIHPDRLEYLKRLLHMNE